MTFLLHGLEGKFSTWVRRENTQNVQTGHVQNITSFSCRGNFSSGLLVRYRNSAFFHGNKRQNSRPDYIPSIALLFHLTESTSSLLRFFHVSLDCFQWAGSCNWGIRWLFLYLIPPRLISTLTATCVSRLIIVRG